MSTTKVIVFSMAFRSWGTKYTFLLAAVVAGSTFAPSVFAQESIPPTSHEGTPTAPPPSQAQKKNEGDDGVDFGIYVDANGAAMFAFASTHDWKADCPAATVGSETWAPQCSTSAPIGLLADGRLGFRFGYVGIELMGVFAGDWSRASFDEAIPGLSADSTMDVGRVGGGFGGGLRFMTSPGLARISAGAAGGVLFRHVYSTISSLEGQSVGYQAPYVMGDVTATFLGFLNVGLVAMVEFAPDVTLQPDFSSIAGPAAGPIEEAIGPVTVFQGPQFFLGPRFGLHFGG